MNPYIFVGLATDTKSSEQKSRVDIIMDQVKRHSLLKDFKDVYVVSRKKEVVASRQLAWYLLQKHTRLSYKDLGKMFGGKDHSTVLNGINRFKQYCEVDEHNKIMINAIEQSLNYLFRDNDFIENDKNDVMKYYKIAKKHAQSKRLRKS